MSKICVAPTAVLHCELGALYDANRVEEKRLLMSEQSVDVCVVGAGVAGIACAQGLARQGASVVLLDRLHPMPECLKAEKIGGEGVLSLLRLGFQPAINAALTPLYNVAVYFGERHLGTLSLNPPEAGMHYQVFVNSLREHLHSRIDFRHGTKATAFNQRPDAVEVATDRGESHLCKLVILATGDARHLLEPLGATQETQPPHNAFAVAFDMEGELRDPHGPVDSVTYHRPQPGAPIAYATLFKLGDALRANIFCPGVVPDAFQRELKQAPLEVLARHNSLLSRLTGTWRVASNVSIRKVQVTRLTPPPAPRVVVLGDAAHTIDPTGGGGLTFSLLEAELLLSFFLPRWLKENNFSAASISTFYNDARRVGAVKRFFGRGQYIYALNHDASVQGKLRRVRFAINHNIASRRGGQHAGTSRAADTAWKLPAPYLYEQFI